MKTKEARLVKRYRIFFLLVALNIAVLIFFSAVGSKSLQLTWSNLLEMMSILPPIFILLGLLDVWVKRETMIKYMGDDSGIIGVLLAFFLGSAAAGPLYAAFPVAGKKKKKGSKLSNVFIMLGAWSTTKIPLILFEASSLGLKFMLVRMVMDLIGIAVIAYFTERMLSKGEIEAIYQNASNR